MKKFAVFGENIGYTLSPRIHKIAFEHMGITAQYDVVSAESGQFSTCLEELFCLDGFNVTKPFKRRMLDFVEPQDEWNAVNTVVMRGHKRLGYNTDVYGFSTHIRNIIDPKDSRVLILGAGGVAEIAVPVLTGMGASVSVYNRTPQKAQELCERWNAKAVLDKSGKYDIVVNCTPCGLEPGENAGDDVNFGEIVLAYDMLYTETEFQKTARASGVPFVENGLAMLIYQAMRADELFFDTVISDKKELFQKIFREVSP